MNKSKFVINVFSNWAATSVALIIAFIVSPIMINQLGDETYGVWVLIVSLTSYFTVLDFGFNTAVVKYIAEYNAKKKYQSAAEVYSAGFILFSVIALLICFFLAIFSLFFKEIMQIEEFSSEYLYLVFMIITIDLAIKMVYSVNTAALKGLQEYFILNVIGMSTRVIRSVILVILLYNDYSLLSLAILQLATGLVVRSFQAHLIKKKYSYLKFSADFANRPLYASLFSYTIYSFLISIASKSLTVTDSVVIGSRLDVSMVTYYAIPQMLIMHLHGLIWAVIAVLIPIISSSEALGDVESKKKLYVVGTRYTLVICSPIALVLFVYGGDFIALWIGEAYREKSELTLLILLSGFLFSFAQLIAHGILKGIGKHKTYALIYCAQAFINAVLSYILAPIYGITGVAIGTIIPMIFASAVLIPYTTCKVLELNYFRYMYESYFHPLLAFLIPLAIMVYLNPAVDSYLELIVVSASALFSYLIYTYFFHLETDQRLWLREKTASVISNRLASYGKKKR